MKILFYRIPKKEICLGTEWVHIIELLNNLSRLGHCIIYANRRRHSTIKYPNFKSGFNRHQSLGQRIKQLLVSHILRGEIRLSWIFLREIRLFISAFLAALEYRPEVIYRRHSYLNSEHFLAKLFKIPLIKEVNGIIADEAKITKRGDNFSLWITKRIERFTIAKADKIIVVTSKLRDFLYRDYKIPREKIIVVQNGANTNLFKPMDIIKAREELGLHRSDNYICYAGSLLQWQGVEYLIKSIPLILDRFPNTKFLIIGDGPTKQELIELTKQTGVSANVVFTGMAPHERVPLYINASDLCVVPKKLLRSGYSPLKLYEYMACEKPVVATRTDGFEILEENNAGLLVNPEDSQEFAQAVVKLLQDPELRKEMGENGRKCVVKNHSWEGVAKRVAEVCEQVIAEHKAKSQGKRERKL